MAESQTIQEKNKSSDFAYIPGYGKSPNLVQHQPGLLRRKLADRLTKKQKTPMKWGHGSTAKLGQY
eukprot:scaffold2644_cov129-Cylindrotheca_fusiformis.AAC.3